MKEFEIYVIIIKLGMISRVHDRLECKILPSIQKDFFSDKILYLTKFNTLKFCNLLSNTPVFKKKNNNLSLYFHN